MILSLAVCTYNRAQILNNCIKSIINQYDRSYPFYLLIIDNNSKDDTQYLLKKFESKYDFIKTFLEKQSGINYARNRAIIESDSEYVGFIDDDAKLGKNYLIQALKIIKEFQPDVFGGPIYPYYINDKPDWFKDKYEIRIHGKTGWVKNGFLSSSNLIIRKDIFDEIGFFNTNFGPSEDKINYGGETELIYRIRKRNKKIYYSKNLFVYHLVPKFKMNILYFLFSNYIRGKNLYQITKTVEDISVMELLDRLEYFFNDLGTELKNDTEQLENVFIEKLANDFNLIGQQSEFLREQLKEQKGLSEIELIKMYKRRNKKITSRMYLSSVFNITKQYLKSVFRNV